MLPVDNAEVATWGAAATSPIAVPGIKAGDVLLAVAQWAPFMDPAGLNPADFTVTTDHITSASIDTAGQQLWVLWWSAHRAS